VERDPLLVAQVRACAKIRRAATTPTSIEHQWQVGILTKLNGIGKTWEGTGAHEAGTEQGRAYDPSGEKSVRRASRIQ